MNLKKILIISLFLMIIASVTIGASYASSEKISTSSGITTDIFDKKIASFHQIYVWEESEGKLHYKINIKKSFQNKYKIQSVKCKYDNYDETGPFYKTNNGKNKNSLVIKPFKDSNLLSMTVNYQTKETIKKESTNFKQKKHNLIRDSEGVGKKANVKLIEKGYFLEGKPSETYITYQKVSIKTINKKYKIKTVRAMYCDWEDKITKTLTFKGNGKTSFSKVIKGNFPDKESFLYEFRITYN